MNGQLVERLVCAAAAATRPEEAIAAVARLAASLAPGKAWELLAAAPAEAEAEHLARFLLDGLGPAPTHDDPLQLLLVPVAWRGRVEDHELEIEGASAPARFASRTLSLAAQTGERGAEAALACAAALVLASLERLEPELVLGALPRRTVRIVVEGCGVLELGAVEPYGIAIEPLWRGG